MSGNRIDAVAENLARRTDAFETFEVEQRDLTASFEAGALRSAETVERNGLGLRVVVGGRMAVGGTGDATALARTVDATIEAAAFGDRCAFEFAPQAAGGGPACYSPAVAEMNADRLVAVGREVVGRLEDLAGDGVTLNVRVMAESDGMKFANSAGQRFDYRTTRHRVSVSLQSFAEGDIVGIWESDSSADAGIDFDALASRVREKFVLSRQVVPLERTDVPVILTPHGLDAFLAPLMAGLDGRNVADGVSPLADVLGGEPIVDTRLTVIDDATVTGRPGTRPFDDEGVPTARTVLIEGGCVKNFLLDLFSAADLGLTSTGNAARDLATSPAPEHSNLVVAVGDTPLADMIAGVKEGLLIDYLMGVGQGNLLAGDYSNAIGLGFAIRDGRIAGRVKGLTLAGNVYRDLARVTAIENAAHWRGATCLPHVRLDGLSVSG
ncbi:MAG: hypothetical protein BIFFINMI_02742 [Phycisphaerae bacterium]|nr:hypothetical protein [Phycisphaerae bacterium]